MQRERILWWVLAVVAVVFLPGYVIDLLHPGLLHPIRQKVTPVDAASAIAALPPGLSNGEKYNRLFQAGTDFARTNKRNEAIANFEAAEQAAQQLAERKDESLREVRGWLASQYEVTERYPETEAVYNRMLDSLRETASDYDINFGSDYEWLSMIRGRESNWPGVEESSRQAIDAYDKTIRHFEGMEDPSHTLDSAHFGKAMSLFRLANAYGQEGKMDFAVYTADQAFLYLTEVNANQQGMLKLFATLGMQLATKAQDQDAIATWRERLDKLQNVPDGTSSGIKVFRLPPPR